MQSEVLYMQSEVLYMQPYRVSPTLRKSESLPPIYLYTYT